MADGLAASLGGSQSAWAQGPYCKIKALGRAESQEVRPDVVTFTSALSAASRAHLWEEARGGQTDMRRFVFILKRFHLSLSEALQLHELLQAEVPHTACETFAAEKSMS